MNQTEQLQNAIKGLEADYVLENCVKWADKLMEEQNRLVVVNEAADKTGDIITSIKTASEMAIITRLMSELKDISDAAKKELLTSIAKI